MKNASLKVTKFSYSDIISTSSDPVIDCSELKHYVVTSQGSSGFADNFVIGSIYNYDNGSSKFVLDSTEEYLYGTSFYGITNATTNTVTEGQVYYLYSDNLWHLCSDEHNFNQ